MSNWLPHKHWSYPAEKGNFRPFLQARLAKHAQNAHIALGRNGSTTQIARGATTDCCNARSYATEGNHFKPAREHFLNKAICQAPPADAWLAERLRPPAG